MTLIALTINHGNPVMMADLLVSSSESSGDIVLPTFLKGTGQMLSNIDGSKPYYLSQKLYVINDNLCVALGGRSDQMFTFLNKVETFYGSVPFDNDNFNTFIDTYDKEDSSELIAITLSSRKVDDNIKFSVRGLGAVRNCDTDRFGNVFAAGSGCIPFLEFVERSPNYLFTDNDKESLHLMANLMLLGYWIGNETATAKTLKDKWGAGYEMIVFKDGKFEKLKEYTIVLLEAKFGKNIEFNSVPFNTIMFSYQEDVLIIRAFAFDQEMIFLAPKVNNKLKELNLENKDPNHSNLLITYIVDNVDNGKTYFPTVAVLNNKNVDPDSPIVFKRVDQKLRLYIGPELDRYIVKPLLSISEKESK